MPAATEQRPNISVTSHVVNNRADYAAPGRHDYAGLFKRAVARTLMNTAALVFMTRIVMRLKTSHRTLDSPWPLSSAHGGYS